jgi:hypothetical protein
MNKKVVDLTTLYNFYKGSLVFFSTDFAGTVLPTLNAAMAL